MPLRPPLQTPLVTLSGHTQPVTGVVWPSADEVVTCGWDHCIRLWDIEACANKSTLVSGGQCIGELLICTSVCGGGGERGLMEVDSLIQHAPCLVCTHVDRFQGLQQC